MNLMGDNGTVLILTDLYSHQYTKGSEQEFEIGYTHNDIKINPKLYEKECSPGLFESSLRDYLKFLYVEYPLNVKISINGSEVDLINPYNKLKNDFSNVFFGEKTEKFAVQILNE